MEKVRIRAGNAENNFRKVSKQVVEEKDLRAAADQRAGDLTAMLETAQQQLQDVERAKAAEDVVTHVAATQTYGNVVEFATQTEDVQAKEAVETCIASVQTEAMGQPGAQMGETEKKLLDTVATRDGSVQTEVMGRPGTQTVEFARQALVTRSPFQIIYAFEFCICILVLFSRRTSNLAHLCECHGQH